jgi:pimeloyl-ACP methyl ester carboxylesterase
VEFQVPKDVKHKYPVILIHGGSQTAANWMGTLDGGEGWRSFFTANGYVVYLVDQVGRGRSPAYNPLPGYTPTDIVTYGEPFNRPANVLGRERTWSVPEQFMDWPQAAFHTQWPTFGQGPWAGKPGDPTFDQFFASQIQSQLDRTGREIQTNMQNAVAALLDKIGPAIVITHSQSGTMGFAIADARPNLVKALVSMEGGARPTAATGNLWPPANIPLTYSPAVTDPLTQLRFVEQAPDPTGLLLTCWLQAEPAKQLPNLARMPHLLLVSEAGSSQRTNHCISKYLTQAGVQNDYVNLKDVGIRGNAHMIMVEKNALQSAAYVTSWIESKLEKKRGRDDD